MSRSSGRGADDPERYRALLEHTHDVLTVVDHDGTVRWESPSTAAVKGYPPEALVGENVIEYVHPEDRDRVVERMRAAVEEVGHLDGRLDMRFRRPDDEWMWLSATATNPGPDSPIDGFVVNSRDATRRKRAERERERERERLDRFAGIVSHDLLSPLNVAKGNVEGVRESHDDPRLGAAVEALERMETLVEDTLALARLGRTIGSTERVALGDVVRRAWEGVPTDGATLETPDEATVEADRERLRTVYENLFGNAVKHGGPGVTVRAGVTDGDDGFGLYVEDDGPGVPAAERERVLEAGYTREEGGTGFGLAIVEEIAEAHGWTVRVTAGETGGARFEVTGVRRAD